MKILISLSLIICLFSCKEKPIHYQGVVVDQNSQPLSNVKIRLRNEANVSTNSNNNGYFKLKKNPGISIFIRT